MKTLTVLGLAFSALTVLLASTLEPADSLAALKQLGISDDEARQSVWYSFSGGYFSYPAKPSLKQVPPEDRATLVTLIGEFARLYTESEEFSGQYRQYREERKPAPPAPPTTAEEDRNAQKQEYQRSIKELGEVMSSMPPDQKKMMQETLTMIEEQLKALDDPDNPMFGAEMDEIKRQGYESGMEDYRQRLSEWNREYPESPRQMIQLRLRQFLSESEGVDFDAKLKRRADGKMIFDNPTYEGKPPNWKLCYRAGRETVESARAFAQRWMTEIESSR